MGRATACSPRSLTASKGSAGSSCRHCPRRRLIWMATSPSHNLRGHDMTAKAVRVRRWISIGGDDPFQRTLNKCRELGIAIINGGKPGWVAWYGLAMLATRAQIQSLEL